VDSTAGIFYEYLQIHAHIIGISDSIMSCSEF
jgi:hypothetical protein